MRRASFAALLALASCRAAQPAVEPKCAPPPTNDEIVICGERYATGAPVVLWTDPGGYDAYDTRFRDGDVPPSADPTTGLRYTPGRIERGEVERALVRADGVDPEVLAEHVDLFVVHYDVCGTSSRCFEVLQHRRGLSVHFLLDVDGTIYQTLDARETAWHAAQANGRSIGVEIAQMGAWPPDDRTQLDEWYVEDERGTALRIPPQPASTLRTPDFDARPARSGVFEGAIHGARLVQYDFTQEQYDSLAKLLAALHRALPKIRLDAPRDAAGRVRMDALSDDELVHFSGVLGHHHVTERKVDPGPAFDWERVLAAARALANREPSRAP